MVDLEILGSSGRPNCAAFSYRKPAVPTENAVHLWRSFAPPKPPTAAEIEMLSHSEVSRANDFRRSEDRIRFLWRRAMLRHILSGYCGFSPAGVDYVFGEYGRPEVVGTSLSFNCAYSDDLIFVAIASGLQVGVDVERIAVERDWRPVAEIAFNHEELTWITRGDSPQDLFTQIWSRREALFKAWGKGLHDSMCDTSLVRDDVLVGFVVDQQDRNWWISQLSAPAGYHAALAASGPVSHVKMLTYTAGKTI